MKINVNGDTRTLTATTVAAALAELGWGDARVATALDGEFVPKSARDTTALTEGCRLEVLSPMQGG